MTDNNTKRDSLITSWLQIENRLASNAGTTEYQVEWGRAREEFYKTIGYIPLSEDDEIRLINMKNAFLGERIFILGNGPSLNKTPLHLLENEFTFVTNRAYLLYDRLNWRPTFFTANDWRVVPDVAHEINLLNGMMCFFEERFRGILREGNDVFWYTHTPAVTSEEKVFAYNIEKGVRGAGSVIGTAIQIAFFLGFRDIYLIGCDLGYKVNKTVIQEGDDVFGTGTKLLLTSTKNDDSNHFDKRYFGEGRRWHDPNVNRMISGHEQCKAGVESGGGRIYNATIGGELEVYPRVDFNSLFENRLSKDSPHIKLNKLLSDVTVIYPFVNSNDNLLGPFLRCEKSHIDETDVIYEYGSSLDARRVMLDVGAHRGTSCIDFLNSGWKIFAFEPDPVNRAALIKKTGDSRYSNNISIDNRAVGDKSQRNVPFYTSEQSSGISGLSSFHSSHKQLYQVNIVSLREFLSDKTISGIDFLKIDTEGYDFFVLKGFPWERFSPSIIECEYEDSKTVPLGYTYRDLADYLIEKGYHVYLSEWHPIVRYGIRHDWHRLTRYPCDLSDENGWGNLLAFKEMPNEELLVSSAKLVLKVGETSPKKEIKKTERTIASSNSLRTNDQTGISFNRWIAHSNYKKVEENKWCYAQDGNDNSFISAIFDFDASFDSVRKFVGAITLKVSVKQKIVFSLARVGDLKYEGAKRIVTLEPDSTQTVVIYKEFSRFFDSFKIQLELIGLPGNVENYLSIEQVSLSMGWEEYLPLVLTKDVDFKLANNLFRNGKYLKALCLYLALYDQMPLDIYKMNAKMSGRNLKFKNNISFEQLRLVTKGVAVE